MSVVLSGTSLTHIVSKQFIWTLSVNGIYHETTVREHRVNTQQHEFIPLALMYKHYLAALPHLKLLYPFAFGLKA